MNPKKTKELLPKLSEDLNLPLDFLTDLTSCYYDHVHSEITSLKHLNVHLPGLGMFSVKGDKVLKRELDRFEPMLKPLLSKPPKTPVRLARFKELKERVEKLNKLLEECKKESERRKLKRYLRYNGYKQPEKNLEGQGKNP